MSILLVTLPENIQDNDTEKMFKRCIDGWKRGWVKKKNLKGRKSI